MEWWPYRGRSACGRGQSAALASPVRAQPAFLLCFVCENDEAGQGWSSLKGTGGRADADPGLRPQPRRFGLWAGQWPTSGGELPLPPSVPRFPRARELVSILAVVPLSQSLRGGGWKNDFGLTNISPFLAFEVSDNEEKASKTSLDWVLKMFIRYGGLGRRFPVTMMIEGIIKGLSF